MTTSPVPAAGVHPAPLRLRRVTDQPARLARIPFLVILSVVLVAGMVGVLILNTVIQGQSQALRNAQSQSASLANEQAALETQVDQLRSVTYLQQAASALGMRPNPNTAVLQLPSGTVLGSPAPAPDNALPDQVWGGPVVQPSPPAIKIVPPPSGGAPAADGAALAPTPAPTAAAPTDVAAPASQPTAVAPTDAAAPSDGAVPADAAAPAAAVPTDQAAAADADGEVA